MGQQGVAVGWWTCARPRRQACADCYHYFIRLQPLSRVNARTVVQYEGQESSSKNLLALEVRSLSP